MYSVADYGSMIADDVRTGAFARALERAIRPDAGARRRNGDWNLRALACRFGARRVYAIEPDDVIQIARDIARRTDTRTGSSSSVRCRPRSPCPRRLT